MATNQVQIGEVLTWTNGTGSAVSAGDVVTLGATTNATLAVALVDIAAAATGSVQRVGVFNVAKVSAAVWKQGEALTWDSSASAFDDNAAVAASGDVAGSVIAGADGAATETTADVVFLGIPGTLTA